MRATGPVPIGKVRIYRKADEEFLEANPDIDADIGEELSMDVAPVDASTHSKFGWKHDPQEVVVAGQAGVDSTTVAVPDNPAAGASGVSSGQDPDTGEGVGSIAGSTPGKEDPKTEDPKTEDPKTEGSKTDKPAPPKSGGKK